ncbi:hypothetical protein DID88_003039 [Monilinia fructigena]|uniref:Uncharacterized protein n=1 Tax=Monilinia fructigena TaxID=38457 RepID=A0A395IHA1_9HELO|nr:hypothetical protein DID88_003039 [Monilinia fructigena]
MTKEREEMANREEEMQTIIQRLKDSLSQRSSSDEETRLSRRSNNSSPNVENGQFAPPSGLNRRSFRIRGGSSSNADALNALEGRSPGASLADELSELNDTENENDQYRRLEGELKSARIRKSFAKDQNKALTLYINKIIERLLQHQDFEAILDSDFKTGDTKGPVNKD